MSTGNATGRKSRQRQEKNSPGNVHSLLKKQNVAVCNCDYLSRMILNHSEGQRSFVLTAQRVSYEDVWGNVNHTENVRYRKGSWGYKRSRSLWYKANRETQIFHHIYRSKKLKAEEWGGMTRTACDCVFVILCVWIQCKQPEVSRLYLRRLHILPGKHAKAPF